MPSEEWYVCTSTDYDGRFNDGPYATREEAIEVARAELKDLRVHDPNRTARIGKRYDWLPTVYGDRAIEQAGLDASDLVGDCADHWLSRVPKDQEQGLTEALTATFRAWMEKHGHEPDFFAITDIEEVPDAG